MSETNELKDQIVELQGEIDRLNARLNVALELLGMCKMGSYPENAGLVSQRLDEALRTDHESAAPEDSTGKIKAAAPVGPAPEVRSSSQAQTMGVDTVDLPPPGGASFTPFVPSEAPLQGAQKPLSQQDHKYDQLTEKDRKLGQALDVLDTLGKRK